MDTSNGGQGATGASDAPSKAGNVPSMYEACSDKGGWFTRGQWEAACKRAPGIFCPLLPVLRLGDPKAKGGPAKQPAQPGPKPAGATPGAQGATRLGSLPLQSTAAPAAETAAGVSCAAEGGSGGGPGVATMSDADVAALEAREPEAHDLQRSDAPSTSAGPSKGVQQGGHSARGAFSKGDKVDSEKVFTEWKDAMQQIMKQMKQVYLALLIHMN